MIISAKYVNKPRKVRRCATCGELISGIQVRLYGCAYPGDPPYAVYIDPGCATDEVLNKLNKTTKENNDERH